MNSAAKGLIDELKAELDKMKKLGVIKKITEPTDWVSSMVRSYPEEPMVEHGCVLMEKFWTGRSKDVITRCQHSKNWDTSYPKRSSWAKWTHRMVNGLIRNVLTFKTIWCQLQCLHYSYFSWNMQLCMTIWTYVNELYNRSISNVNMLTESQCMTFYLMTIEWIDVIKCFKLCVPYLLAFMRYSQLKCAWLRSEPIEWVKIKRKYASQKQVCDFYELAIVKLTSLPVHSHLSPFAK